MTKEFLYFTSIVNYRIPVDNGVAGTPEILSKFTTETHNSRTKRKATTKEIIVTQGDEETI